MTTIAENDKLRVERLRLGPYDTNAYILVCRQTLESVLVDAPAEPGRLMERLAGTRCRYVLLTHGHADHTGALAALRSLLEAPIAAHHADAARLPVQPDIDLADGATVAFGNIRLAVLHTPGHTPGSLCFRYGKYLLSGDTIFPGGPGNTKSPEAFQQIVSSLVSKVFPLDDETEIYPGHGDSTLLQKEREEFAAFSSRPHAPGLCGDVLWLTS